MALPSANPGDAFRFRRLEKPEEFRALEEVERLAWGLVDEPPVPSTIQRAVQDNGGLVLGAFADIHLAGFALGFLGWDGTQLYHYSHRTAVRPEYRNHQLGFRLKAFQRDEVLRQGLPEVRWAFDPLQSRNALLGIRRLGARIHGYKVHYYGQLSSEVDRGLETDRVTVRWNLTDATVEARVQGVYPRVDEDLARYRGSTAIVETEAGESGLRIPVAVQEPTAETAHLEVPFDIALIRAHEPASLRTWRHAVRDAFRAALDTGYECDDFAVITTDHERRSFYFLRRAPAPPASNG
jgi:predicted GNAT superfamily acetyltransferase